MMIGSTLLFGVLLFAEEGTAGATGTLYTGIGLALVTTAVVFVVTVPSFKKVIKIAQDMMASKNLGPPPPEMMKYGTRARQGSMLGVVLLLIVLAAMVASVVGF